MARASDILNLTGTIGGMTFYTRNGKSFVRAKSRLNKAQMKADESFKLTLQQSVEFGAGSTAGKYILHALANNHRKTADSSTWMRLKKKLGVAIKQATGERGRRPLTPTLALDNLDGLEWNREQAFTTLFLADFTLTHDPATGQTDWNIPLFHIKDNLRPPTGSTHFRMFLQTISLPTFEYNPSKEKYQPQPMVVFLDKAFSESAWLPLNTQFSIPLQLSHQIPVSPTNLPLIFTGIEFSQEVSGLQYPLKQKMSMRIQKV